MSNKVGEIEKSRADARIDPCEGEGWHPVKAWLAVLASCFFLLVGSAGLNLLAPVLSLILDEYSLDANFGASLNSIVSIVSLISAVPAGLAIDKFGFRRMAFFTYLIMISSGVIGAAFCNDVFVLLLVRVLNGIAYVFPPIIGVYVATQWFPRSKQAFPITLVAASTSMARALVQQMSKIAIPLGGWHAQFALYAACAIMGFVLFWFFMKPGPGYALAEHERLEKKAQERAPIVQVARNPLIWAVILLQFMYALVSRGFMTFQNMIFIDTCQVSAATAADLGTIMNIMPIIGGVFMGWVLNRSTSKKYIVTTIMISTYFVVYALPYLMTEAWQAWLFAIVVGFTTVTQMFTQASMPKIATSPAVLIMALTMFNFIGKYLAAVIAPYIISVVFVITGSWQLCWIPMGIIGLAGIALLLVVTRKLVDIDKTS